MTDHTTEPSSTDQFTTSDERAINVIGHLCAGIALVSTAAGLFRHATDLVEESNLGNAITAAAADMMEHVTAAFTLGVNEIVNHEFAPDPMESYLMACRAMLANTTHVHQKMSRMDDGPDLDGLDLDEIVRQALATAQAEQE